MQDLGASSERYRRTVVECSAMLALDPAQPETWRRRGEARFALADLSRSSWKERDREYAAALADLDRAVALPSASALTWVARGDLRTTRELQRAIHSEPRPVFSFQSAVEDYTTALALDAGCLEAWLGRGIARCYWANCRRDGGERSIDWLAAAIEDFENALRFDPHSRKAAQWLEDTRLSLIATQIYESDAPLQ